MFGLPTKVEKQKLKNNLCNEHDLIRYRGGFLA